MLRRQVVRDVKLKPIGYKILLEILVRGRPAVVREVPYVFEVRARGRVSLAFKSRYASYSTSRSSKETTGKPLGSCGFA